MTNQEKAIEMLEGLASVCDEPESGTIKEALALLREKPEPTELSKELRGLSTWIAKDQPNNAFTMRQVADLLDRQDRHIRITDGALEVKEQLNESLRQAIDRLKQSNGNAFVAGAKWWEFYCTGATMFPSGAAKAEAEAKTRGYEFRHVQEKSYEAEIDRLTHLVADLRGELSKAQEAVNVSIDQQGAPEFSGGVQVILESSYFVAFELDMKSKHCVLGGSIGGDNEPPGVIIEASTDSLHLRESVPRDAMTVVLFPDYKGWHVWCAECLRYTLRVCLQKEQA